MLPPRAKQRDARVCDARVCDARVALAALFTIPRPEKRPEGPHVLRGLAPARGTAHPNLIVADPQTTLPSSGLRVLFTG